MKVILHADDFGFDRDTLEATIECFEQGALSSCTVMVNCEASEAALDYARLHPQFSYGVHLTYVDELLPVMPAREIPSLVDERGVFLPSNTVRRAALAMRLPVAEIVAESQAQIHRMESAGVAVSHLDSHGHLHKFPAMLRALKSLRVGGVPVRRVRGVQNVFVEPPRITSPAFWLNKGFKWWLARNFANPDYFYMSANNMDTNWADNILSQMDRLPADATIEIGVHPGKAEEWRRHELADIIDFATKLRRSGKHQIITWNEI
jgi:hypothetical protein